MAEDSFIERARSSLDHDSEGVCHGDGSGADWEGKWSRQLSNSMRVATCTAAKSDQVISKDSQLAAGCGVILSTCL